MSAPPRTSPTARWPRRDDDYWCSSECHLHDGPTPEGVYSATKSSPPFGGRFQPGREHSHPTPSQRIPGLSRRQDSDARECISRLFQRAKESLRGCAIFPPWPVRTFDRSIIDPNLNAPSSLCSPEPRVLRGIWKMKSTKPSRSNHRRHHSPHVSQLTTTPSLTKFSKSAAKYLRPMDGWLSWGTSLASSLSDG